METRAIIPKYDKINANTLNTLFTIGNSSTHMQANESMVAIAGIAVHLKLAGSLAKDKAAIMYITNKLTKIVIMQ